MKMLQLIKIYAKCIIFLLSLSFYLVHSVYFDPNDIFDERLMPLHIFFGDHGDSITKEFKQSSNLSIGLNNSDYNTAYISMVYHRNMMNEFMATDFLYQQIVNEYLQNSNDSFRIGKRMAAFGNTSNHQSDDILKPNEKKFNLNHKLLDDEGMLRYKSWLERTTTLEDIHRHLTNKDASSLSTNTMSKHMNTDLAKEKIDEEQDFDEGDITGYALTNSPYDMNLGNHQFWPQRILPAIAAAKTPISKNGYENGYDEYRVHAPPPTHPHPQPVYSAPANIPVQQPTQNKEIGIKDITDIALTTLAFLSFGMFILQVLMCITMGKEDVNNMMMLPMEAVDSSEIPIDGAEEIRRKRRSTPTRHLHILQINEVARRVLFSIDAVMYLPKDNGSCHYWTMCENNRYARKLGNNQKFWMPVWSLGTSWLAGKFYSENSTTIEYKPIMESLKAAIVGLSDQDCKSYYTEGCDQMTKGLKI